MDEAIVHLGKGRTGTLPVQRGFAHSLLNKPQPRSSRYEHICPYRQYLWPGPGVEGRGVAWVDTGARGRADVGGELKGGMLGKKGGQQESELKGDNQEGGRDGNRRRYIGGGVEGRWRTC